MYDKNIWSLKKTQKEKLRYPKYFKFSFFKEYQDGYNFLIEK
jgi:hypothetical protein